MITVRPGETLRVTVGGGGRTIVGKAMVREEAKLSPNWTSQSHMFQLQAPPYFKPPNMTKEERKVWYANWSQSPPGRAYLAWQEDRRFHAILFAADGSFRIEDVRPGTYQFLIRPTGDLPNGVVVAHAEVVVVVPELADGDLEKPLDLGTITLKPGPK